MTRSRKSSLISHSSDSEARILVSACLVGWKCRYNGGDKLDKSLILKAKTAGWTLVPVCPEVLGGLPVPRMPATISVGDGYDVLDGKSKVIASDDSDVTRSFIAGAEETLRVAQHANVKYAILKDFSPSCGCNKIRDVSGRERKGVGVAAALLIMAAIKVIR